MRSLLFFLLFWPATALSQDVARATGPDDCPLTGDALPDWWGAGEVWAWNRICAGEVADMREAPGGDPDAGCDALDETEWPSERTLSARFLRQIASTTPWTDAPLRRAVRVECAIVEEALDFRYVRVPQTLRIGSTRFGGYVDFKAARIDGTLSLEGSHVPDGEFYGSSLRVADDLLLRSGSLGEVTLLGAKIGGDVLADGSSFTELFNADRMEVGGSLFLRDGASFAGVILLGAKIGGDVLADGSSFTELFNADRMEVGGSLFLRDGASFAGVDLLGAKIGGNVEANGSSFTELFNADGMEVGGSLFLRGGAGFSGLVLSGAAVDGSVQLQGSDFSGPMDLSAMRIADTLRLSFLGSQARFGAGAQVSLRNTHAAALQAAMPNPAIAQASGHPWRRPDGSSGHEALPVDLTNFTYERLGGFGDDAEADLSQIRSVELIAWVAQSRDVWIAQTGGAMDAEGGYAPQPYMHLATTLRGMGAEAAAEEVDYARMLHRMETRESGWARALDHIARIVVGFGIYPERAAAWFAGLVGLGLLVSYASPAFRGTGIFTRGWFSLNNALPLVPLSERFDHLDDQSPDWVANAFTAQKIAGFGLATVLVGALTLLGGQGTGQTAPARLSALHDRSTRAEPDP